MKMVQLILFIIPIIYLIFNLNNLKTTYHDFGDSALICIKVNFAKEVKEYLGPYSRMEFFHPGPILYYYYAFLDVIISKTNVLNNFISKSNVYGIFQFLLNFFLLNVTFFLIPKNINLTLRILVIILFLLFFENLYHGNISNVFSIWNPFIILIPFFVLLVSSALVYDTQQYKFLPLIFLMNSIIISNHLSGILYSGLFTFLFLFFLVRKSNHYKNFFIWFSIAVVISIVSFLPPIFEFFLNFPDNNLFKIIEISKTTSSLRKGKDVFIYFFELISIFVIGKPNYFVGIFIFFTIIFIIEFLKKNIFSPYLKILYNIANFQTFLAIVYIFKIPFDLLHYLSWFYLPVFLLYVFIFLNCLFYVLKKEMYFITFLFVLGAAMMFQLYNKTKSTVLDYHKEYFVIQEIFKYTYFDQGIYKISWGFGDENHQNWVMASGLILKLLEKKIHVCVDKEWLFMFGKDFSCPKVSEKNIKNIYIKKNTEMLLEPIVNKEKEKIILQHFNYKIVVEN